MNAKPLIFIYPLSETMKKLKEAIEEISESEGVEVYEVDEISEISQLIPTVGQSLSIYGTPKKCAMSLKTLRKVNAKLNSKVLLINEKGIPRKTLDKFSKIGLTEFIQEPVAAKTLLYKVKLQLKSIVNEDSTDEEESGVKSSGSTSEENEDSMYKSSNKNKNDKDEDGLDYLTKKGPKNKLEVEAIEEEKKKKNYNEEDIESNWQGKVKKEEESYEEEESLEEESEKEESIDGYLRGKKEKEELSLEEDEKQKNKYKDEILESHLKGKLKLDDLDEPEEVPKKAEDTFLDIEEKTKQLQLEAEKNSSYYKGKIKKHANEEEDDELGRTENDSNLLVDEEDADYLEKESEEEQVNKKKKSETQELDIEDNDIKQEHIDEDEEEGITSKKDNYLEEDDKKSPNESEVEHLESEDELGEGSTDKIDKYLRGGKAKKDEEVDEEDSKDLKTKSEELIIDNKENKSKEDQEEDLDDKDYKNEKEIHLLDEEENEEHTHDDQESVSDKEFLEKKKSTELDLEDSLKDKNHKDEDSTEYRSNNPKDNESEEEKEQRKKNQHEEKESKNKAHEGQVDDLTKENLKANSKVEKIQTHYSSEASVSHIDDDWTFGKSDKKREEEESRKNSEDTLTYGEKVDLGEQTIDYRKLKDEFGGITIDREGNNLKKTGPKYYGGDSAKKRTTPTYYRDDEEIVDTEEIEEIEDEEEDSSDIIYEPNSKGLEHVIRVLNFYNSSDLAEEQTYKYIAKVIQTNFNGEVALFYYNEKKGRVTEATNSLNLLSEIEKEEKKPIWEDLISKYRSTWKDTKLPSWSDETFQDSNIQFIYPYFEGTSLMGFSVTWFTSEFDEKRCKELEVTLETLRGFLISNFRKNLNSGKYEGTETKKETKASPVKSFFGKLFGRKTA